MCVSGRVSGNTCNARVSQGLGNFNYCPSAGISPGNPVEVRYIDEGCVFNMFILHHNNGKQLTTGGDSGGPVYVCVDSNGDPVGTGSVPAGAPNPPAPSYADKWCDGETYNNGVPAAASRRGVKAVGFVTGSLVPGDAVVSRLSDLHSYPGFEITVAP